MPVIHLNKPVGPTSHDMVSKIRKITAIRRVGHAGTLDPLASGVLVMGIGRESTKQLGHIVKTEKTYEAEIMLGSTSSTDDAEGVLNPRMDVLIPTQAQVSEALTQFVGTIEQTPPIYSAIHIQGQKAYTLARKGKTIIMEPRPVTIYTIKLLDYSWPLIRIKVVCAAGVYIRSLARDLGKALATGAYLSGLIRTRVGDYPIETAFTLDTFAKWWTTFKE